MRVKRVVLKDFKRFTHLTVEGIPETAKLVVMVGPNGSGKTSFMEAINHYYQYSGFYDVGEYRYLGKRSGESKQPDDWFETSTERVDIDFYDIDFPKNPGYSNSKEHFYFRSAYRNEVDVKNDALQKQRDPKEVIRIRTLNLNDETVSANYQRLVSSALDGLFSGSHDEIKVREFREELTKKIQDAVKNVFKDLTLSSLGHPIVNGSFFFTKGITENFPYLNLSAGEKSAFDLILDLVVNSQYYSNSVYCIDEPEAHMHTQLQGKVLRELYDLVPSNSQLWISTHSVGMLQEAEKIESELPGTVTFLDFGSRDFDEQVTIRPTPIGKAVVEKFLELAFGDFAKLILPRTIVFCEGNPNGGLRKNFDKNIFTTIFGSTHADTLFISGGSCNDVERSDQVHGEIETVLLKNSRIIKIIDRDDRSDQEVTELLQRNIKTLSRRNLEGFLLDDSLIEKLCIEIGKQEKTQDCLDAKKKVIEKRGSDGKPLDDMKSASGEIFISLRRILELTRCGNTVIAFLRDTMAPLITPDTDIYKELEVDIFGVPTKGGLS